MFMKGYFYFQNMLRCKTLILFMTLQYMLAFLILHSAVEEIYGEYNLLNYVTKSSENIFWMNGVIGSYMKQDDEESLLNFAEELVENSAIEKVGYTKEGSVLFEPEEELMPLLVMDEVCSGWEYKLNEGKWFDFSSNETQFILGGKAKKNYHAGEQITLKVEVKDGDRITYEEYTGRVVGILRDPAYVIELGTSSYPASKSTLTNRIVERESLVLTNDDRLLEGQNYHLPLASILVKAEDGKTQEAEAFLNNYVECVTLAQITNNTKDFLWSQMRLVIYTCLPQILIVLYGIIGVTFMFVHKNRQALAIYEMCGQMPSGRRHYILLSNGLPMMLGLALSFLLLSFESLKDIFSVYEIWTEYHIIASVVLMAVFVMVMCLCVDIMMRKTTVANMKRNE